MAMKLLYPESIVDINIETFVYFSNFTVPLTLKDARVYWVCWYEYYSVLHWFSMWDANSMGNGGFIT